MFSHGYALLIGVDKNQIGKLALPVVAKDVERLKEVIIHPDRCAYPEDNVRVLTAEDATRANILIALAWLAKKLEQDKSGNETAIIYYSGHGHRTKSGEFFLLPYDMILPVTRNALPAPTFAEIIGGIKPRRLLVVLDCCHAGGMELKGDLDEDIIESTAITSQTLGFAELTKGEGRAVLSSSQSNEESWIRQDCKMSVFTYHLTEALIGQAGRVGAQEVLVTEVMDYVARKVPETTASERNVPQTPVFKFNGTAFPIALIMGGIGVTKGNKFPDPFDSLPPKVVTGITAGKVEGEVIGTDIGEMSGGTATTEIKLDEVKKGGTVIGARVKHLGGKP